MSPLAATDPKARVAKKHECQSCKRRFVRREHLQRHERSHTKEKPFSCRRCSQAFTRSDLLVRHNRLRHTTPETEGDILSPSPSQSSSSSRLPQLQTPAQPLLNHNPATNHSQPQTQPLPMQPQVYEGIHGHHSYAVANSSPQLELQTPQWLQENPALISNSSMPGSSTMMGTPMPDAWFTMPNIENGGDFSSFLDSNALPSHQYSYFFQFEHPLPYFSPDPLTDTPIVDPESQHHSGQHDHANGVDVMSEQTQHDSLTQFGSRLPSLQPEDHVRGTESRKDTAPVATASHHQRHLVLTNVSVEARATLVSKLASLKSVIPPGFTIVSRHALSRYITGFISGFHEHLPFLHLPSMSVETASLELVLALAAIGAQYCREPEKGLEIFKVAKAVCFERVRRRDERRASLIFNDGAESVLSGGTSESGRREEADIRTTAKEDDDKPIETAQALLILMAMATWFERRPPAREAPAIRSLLETLIRDEGLKTTPLPETASWEDWIQHEGAKRTKFVAFAFFNLHSIVFDIPPMILSGKIDMDLPCIELEWKAPNEAIWRERRRMRVPEPKFLDTLKGLFRGNTTTNTNTAPATRPRFSSLGLYVLIHAIIQHIWLTQELFRGQPSSPTTTSSDPRNSSSLPYDNNTPAHLPPTSVASFETALKSWQQSWERNPESSVDPLSPHGPLSFNSTALLRLAYIRINVDTGSIRSLGSCNPASIAASIRAAPPVARSKRMTRAALHCAHALSIPIKLGINSIAHTRLFWSIQHVLCSLECALLLTKWLESVTPLVGRRVEDGGLTEAEGRLLGFVVEMVAETEWAAPEEELLQDEKRLSAVVVRVWARLFRRDDIWEMVDVIGRSLEVYADMLEADGK